MTAKDVLDKGIFLYSLFVAGVMGNLFLGIWLGGSPQDEVKQLEVPSSVGVLFNHLAKQSIKEGSEVHETVPVQLFLQAKNYDIGGCGADGIYGSSMRQAILEYQSDQRLHEEPGTATILTLQRMASEIERDKELEAKLNQELLAPFKTEKVKNFLKHDTQDVLPKNYGLSLFVRPDIALYAAYEVFRLEDRNVGATKVFSGCLDGNSHRKDAFRHAERVIAMSADIGTDWAAKLGNLREKSGGDGHTLPESLMDIYNHKVAAEIARETGIADGKDADLGDVVATNIQNGRFLIYPFPLVPKTETPPVASIR